MTTQTIYLPNGNWCFDELSPLGGAGGFGEVFRGEGPHGEVAVKRLKISAEAAAHRELVIGQELMKGVFKGVVPILDAGQDSKTGRYFLVMPICQYSLQKVIDDASGPLEKRQVQQAIRQIIEGLAEVPEIVHRDLKPANILLHEGRWKIADFGIAKFVEDATSLETLRGSLTPSYAAPEQWRGERPSAATDIYAVGCIIHALCTGMPPFSGSLEDIRDSHLNSAPKTLENLPPRLNSFVSHMLRKTPSARPTLQRCQNVLLSLELEDSSSLSNPSVVDLASEHVAKQEAEAEARAQAAAASLKVQRELFKEAKTILFSLKNALFQRLSTASESVSVISESRLHFGRGTLMLDSDPQSLLDYNKNLLYPKTKWEVVCWSTISIYCSRSDYTWSATLLYADMRDGNGYRWYELAFWTWRHHDPSHQPYALEGHCRDIDLACSHGMHSVALAYGPLSIDGEDEDSFYRRWETLAARAAIGRLECPGGMPIRDLPG